MGYSHADALRLLAEIEGLESTVAAKRHTLRVAIAQLADGSSESETEDGYLCPECGVRRTRADQLSEHRENVHGVRDWPAQPGYPEHIPPHLLADADALRRANAKLKKTS